MIRRIHLGKVLIAVVFIVLMPLVANASMDTSEIDKSVIRIYNEMPRDTTHFSTGTGFVVNESGYVVTNYHVIDESKDADGVAQIFKAIIVNGKLAHGPKATVVWSDKHKDLAILKIEGLGLPALTLYTGSVIQGESVVAIGFPGISDKFGGKVNATKSTVTDGILSRSFQNIWKGNTGDPFTIIQHSAQLNHGNSGGPLFNQCKSVIGINTQKPGITIGGIDLNISDGAFFSSSIKNVIEALKENHIKFKSSSSCNPESDALINQGLMMGGIALLMGLLFGRKRTREVIIKEVTKYTRKSKINKDPSQPSQSTWRLSINVDGWPKKTPLNLKQMKDSKGLVIGRDANVSNCPLKDSSISRRHCRLMLYQGSLYIEDLNSTNGTMVNGKAITPFQSVQVSNGDELVIGDLQATLVESR